MDFELEHYILQGSDHDPSSTMTYVSMNHRISFVLVQRDQVLVRVETTDPGHECDQCPTCVSGAEAGVGNGHAAPTLYTSVDTDTVSTGLCNHCDE